MERHTNSQDIWEHDAWDDERSPVLNFSKNDSTEKKHEGPQARSESLYQKYGTNEPYSKPENMDYDWNLEHFFELMTGPSTNFYVGPDEKHYTIPKRLLYHFSGYAKACLEGHFSEARANAVWLRDVDPDVFQWLWQWLYSGELKVYRRHHWSWTSRSDEQLPHACQLLCRVHILGERLLFDHRLLWDGVQRQLESVIADARTAEGPMPLTPAIVEEVLEGSGPVDYGSRGSWASNSLRPFVLRYLCTFEFCTVVEFMDYVECFELDGAFAAEIMKFLASEMKWAVDRWGAHMGASIDVTEKKRQILEEEGNAQCIAKSPKTRKGVWLALRYMCTFSGCQTTDFRAYSQCFELDGGFAAEILNYMVRELRWIVEVWGKERGWTVDVAREREDEAYDLQERSDLEHTVQKYMRRGGWS